MSQSGCTEADIWVPRGRPYRVDYRDHGLPCLLRKRRKESAERAADRLRAEGCTEVRVVDLRVADQQRQSS